MPGIKLTALRFEIAYACLNRRIELLSNKRMNWFCVAVRVIECDRLSEFSVRGEIGPKLVTWALVYLVAVKIDERLERLARVVEGHFPVAIEIQKRLARF